MFGLHLENHFARLGSGFFTAMPAERVGTVPRLLHANAAAAGLIDLDPAVFGDPRFTQVMSGHLPLEGFAPLAMVYSGHQFGVWAGQLGDGRALLIGQARNRHGELWDIQLKGAGKTPYSRFGDGRAVLRSSIREYLCSEAMAALNIPTSRALCLIATGETVYRERPEPGAVIARLAQSHIRFGHFEHFHYAGNADGVRALADHVIAEHFPGLGYGAWYDEVVRRTAVMVAHWNLRALAVALSRIVPADQLVAGLETFEGHFSGAYRALMRAKLGLKREEEGDDRLIGDLLAVMAKGRADYTLTFRQLPHADGAWLEGFAGLPTEAQAWLSRYRNRTADEDLSALNTVNPKFVLRNWVAETVIRAVEDHGDVAALERLMRILQTPYDEHLDDAAFAAPPPPQMCGLEVSCSS